MTTKERCYGLAGRFNFNMAVTGAGRHQNR